MRVLLAIWAGKLAAAALRVLGWAGTHVPGIVARRIHPGIIAAIQHPARVVVVTGTNGKTTVSNLLAEALEGEGLRVASNRNGSNLAAGVAATLIGAVTWTGRSRADIGVFEMDERSAKLVLPGLDPDVLVCMNLTRDSIKRNAHPAYIAWILSSALPERTRLVLNIDEVSERTTEVENIAWIYDADYEYLAHDSFAQIVVGGVRRYDQALRLAIAGVAEDRIVTVQSELETAETVELEGADVVFNLHSVHNALITGNPVQKRLRERLHERTQARS